MQQPDFQDRYRAAKRQVVEQSITRLQQVTSEAVDVLREIMLDREATASSRVSAAKAVLEMAVKAVEVEDLAARLEELERVLEEQTGKFGGGR